MSSTVGSALASTPALKSADDKSKHIGTVYYSRSNPNTRRISTAIDVPGPDADYRTYLEDKEVEVQRVKDIIPDSQDPNFAADTEPMAKGWTAKEVSVETLEDIYVIQNTCPSNRDTRVLVVSRPDTQSTGQPTHGGSEPTRYFSYIPANFNEAEKQVARQALETAVKAFPATYSKKQESQDDIAFANNFQDLHGVGIWFSHPNTHKEFSELEDWPPKPPKDSGEV